MHAWTQGAQLCFGEVGIKSLPTTFPPPPNTSFVGASVPPSFTLWPLPFTVKNYLKKAKEEVWKLKHFTMQKI
jgi:hypothetical protein